MTGSTSGAAPAPAMRSMTLRSSSAARVADLDLQHEAVELRLGQRVGALLLDRVLRREDEERLGRAGASRSPIVTWRSCIASSSAALHLGGRAVDLVGEDEVGEDRPLAWS